MSKVTQWMREHPYLTGVIVVVGGFVFLLLTGVLGGGSSSSDAGGPSDAEVAANATIQAAQIQAQAQAAAAAAGVQNSQIAAGVQMHSDDLSAQVAMEQLRVQQTLGLDQGVTDRANIDAQKDVAIENYRTQLGTVQAYTGAQVKMNSSNNKQKNVGGIIGTIGGIIGSIFSDENLKENIRFVGYTKTGNGVYSFNYRGSDRTRLGYIAQDVMRDNPEAVGSRGGYATVDLRMLGSPKIAKVEGPTGGPAITQIEGPHNTPIVLKPFGDPGNPMGLQF